MDVSTATPAQELLITAIVAGLGGMAGWGLADFFAKTTIDRIGDMASLAWGHVFGTVVLALAFVSEAVLHHRQPSFPTSFRFWGLAATFGALQAVIYLLVYRGFSKGQLAVLNPVFACFSGLTVVLSIAVFGEAVRPILLLGLAVIFLGVFLLNADVSALRKYRLRIVMAPGMKEIGIATILAAFWTVLWDKAVKGQDWLLYTLLMYAFMTIVILLIAWIRQSRLKVSDAGTWPYLILIGICEVGAYLFVSWGYSSTRFTSVVAMLSGAFSLPTIVLARVFLKERITMAQTIGGLLAVGGIILLAAH